MCDARDGVGLALHLRGAQQSLGRDARPAAALAAHELALHERDALHGPRQDGDCVLAARPGPHDHHVEAIRHRAPDAMAYMGRVSPGTVPGAAATQTARARSTSAMPRLAPAFHGSSFSPAISAATNTIQPMLMIPSANSDAISAQQQPRHQPPCSAPMRSAPAGPPRQLVSTKPP